MWSEKAMSLLGRAFRTAVHHGDDRSARHDMALAATFAGMGFGNAGVHLPHANAYPIAGMVKDFRPPGYPQHEPMVPHGIAVSLTAPEAFRFGFDAAPERHLRVAALLAPTADRVPDPADQLPAVLVDLMRDIGIPNGIGGSGLHRGGCGGPRAGHVAAAAAARHLRQDAHPGRHRGHPDPVPDQLVTRPAHVSLARDRAPRWVPNQCEAHKPERERRGTRLAWSECLDRC
jgi:alcohol dehydrogenase class IV